MLFKKIPSKNVAKGNKSNTFFRNISFLFWLNGLAFLPCFSDEFKTLFNSEFQAGITSGLRSRGGGGGYSPEEEEETMGERHFNSFSMNLGKLY